MLSVYDRIRKLSSCQSLQERMMLPYTAILNLTDTNEIREFTQEYLKLFEVTGKHDMQYMLSFFEIDDRKLWKEAIGDLFYIDVLFNRPERELYRFFEEENADGEFYNKEKGNHQNVLSIGEKIIKTKATTMAK